MDSIKKPQTRRAPGPWLAAMTLVMLVFGLGAQAVADGAVGSLNLYAGDVDDSALATLASDRNPDDFLADIAPPVSDHARAIDAFATDAAPALTMPVVMLTRDDAVAMELAVNSRTLSRLQALRTARAICEEARRLGYDPLLFVAVISVESSFNHMAVSPVGAQGLMQLMPGTAEFVAGRGKLAWASGRSFDPVLNVRLGARYLAELNLMFRNHLDEALTAYNRGPANTRFILQHHKTLPQDIRAFYAGRVLTKYLQLKKAYGRLPFAQSLAIRT